MGSDGGRGSYGGEREWCRVLERGSSPGLVVACVRSSLPMSTRRFPCPHVMACVCASLPVSAHRCLCLRVVARVCVSLPVPVCHSPCPHVVPRVRASLPASVHIRGRSFRSWAWVVVFVCGRCLRSGVVHLCSWAVCVPSWATAQCGGREPLVGGGESSGLV